MTLTALLDRFHTSRLLVLGDVFLDEYILGRPERLSREAPVPVLEFRSRRCVPGGGANPAMNAAALGAHVSLAGVVGPDAEAVSLRELLNQAGIDTSGLITDPARPTITKTRIVADSELRFPQQVVRVDRLERAPLDPATEAAVLSAVRRLVVETTPSAILVSDYRSGLLSPALVEAVREIGQVHNLTLTADTQGELGKYHGFALVKCNRAEAEAFLGRPLSNDDDAARALAELTERLNIRAVLITRGSRGASVGVRGGECVHIPAANVSEVYDVTGAGDTVIAVATLALCAGAGPAEAARLANAAAGIVVRRWGNAVVSRAELAEALSQ